MDIEAAQAASAPANWVVAVTHFTSTHPEAARRPPTRVHGDLLPVGTMETCERAATSSGRGHGVSFLRSHTAPLPSGFLKDSYFLASQLKNLFLPPSPSPTVSTGPFSMLQFTLDVISSMGLGKCTVTYVCH